MQGGVSHRACNSTHRQDKVDKTVFICDAIVQQIIKVRMVENKRIGRFDHLSIRPRPIVNSTTA